jgi:hypothetical protein
LHDATRKPAKQCDETVTFGHVREACVPLPALESAKSQDQETSNADDFVVLPQRTNLDAMRRIDAKCLLVVLNEAADLCGSDFSTRPGIQPTGLGPLAKIHLDGDL